MRPDVGEHHPRRWQRGQRRDRPVALDGPAEARTARSASASMIACEPPAASGHPTGVTESAEQQTHSRGQRAVEREHRSGRRARRTERAPPRWRTCRQRAPWQGAGQSGRSGLRRWGAGAHAAPMSHRSAAHRPAPPRVRTAGARRRRRHQVGGVDSTERSSSTVCVSSGWASVVEGGLMQAAGQVRRTPVRRSRTGGSPSRRRGEPGFGQLGGPGAARRRRRPRPQPPNGHRAVIVAAAVRPLSPER